jgi:hypothetical protein
MDVCGVARHECALIDGLPGNSKIIGKIAAKRGTAAENADIGIVDRRWWIGSEELVLVYSAMRFWTSVVFCLHA